MCHDDAVMLSCYDVMSNSHLQAPHPPALRTRSGRTIRKVTDTDLQVIGPAERAEMDKHDRMQTALFRWRYASLVKAWNAWKEYVRMRQMRTSPQLASPLLLLIGCSVLFSELPYPTRVLSDPCPACVQCIPPRMSLVSFARITHTHELYPVPIRAPHPITYSHLNGALARVKGKVAGDVSAWDSLSRIHTTAAIPCNLCGRAVRKRSNTRLRRRPFRCVCRDRANFTTAFAQNQSQSQADTARAPPRPSGLAKSRADMLYERRATGACRVHML